MGVWLIKCRESLPDREGWSWDSYFDRDGDWYGAKDTWGDSDWICSRQSRKYIREGAGKVDLVVCYQSEGRRICGLTFMAGDGLEDPVGSDQYCVLQLPASRKALCLQPPLPVEELRATGCSPEWLGKGHGTIFPVTDEEFRGILRAIRTCCPDLRDRLDEWLGQVGYEVAVGTAVRATVRDRRAGGGFAVDQAKKLKVERRAVQIVTQRLRHKGWKVQSRERDCCGYDLCCTKGRKRLDVEVKGVSGSEMQFPITQGEVKQARDCEGVGKTSKQETAAEDS